MATNPTLIARLEQRIRSCQACRSTGRIEEVRWNHITFQYDATGEFHDCDACELDRDLAAALRAWPEPTPVDLAYRLFEVNRKLDMAHAILSALPSQVVRDYNAGKFRTASSNDGPEPTPDDRFHETASERAIITTAEDVFAERYQGGELQLAVKMALRFLADVDELRLEGAAALSKPASSDEGAVQAQSATPSTACPTTADGKSSSSLIKGVALGGEAPKCARCGDNGCVHCLGD